MPKYEHVFIARPDISSGQVEGLTNSFKEIVEGMGGKIGKVEYWGLRNLSFRINKNRKGHYSLLNIEAPYEAINELERQERLSEDILRSLTVGVDDHEETPSAMMQNRGERSGRRGDGRERGGRGRDRDDFDGDTMAGDDDL
jgi:small subunit ribosomal protein S6